MKEFFSDLFHSGIPYIMVSVFFVLATIIFLIGFFNFSYKILDELNRLNINIIKTHMTINDFRSDTVENEIAHLKRLIKKEQKNEQDDVKTDN